MSLSKSKVIFRYYSRNKDHKLVNAANVDNSYKWAGGGFLSTVIDLVSFGNAMHYSYQAGVYLALGSFHFGASICKIMLQDLNEKLLDTYY